MKKQFFDYIDVILQQNTDVYLLLVGLGYPRVDELLSKYPDRVINTEASEQTALDIAVGLAYAGKIPFVYTITPFLYRGFETIRTYINHEELNIKLIGAGRDDDYSKHDGFSHDAKDVTILLGSLQNIHLYFPDDVEQLQTMLDMMTLRKEPSFLSLRR